MKNIKTIKVVSLFDGISCGRVALEQLGYTIGYYAAFEIDKFAKSISKYNFPDIEQFGDVMQADFYQFANMDIDIVMAGSPCTTWSVAKNNREIDKNGIGWALFMKFVEAVRVINPRFFLYENVYSMHKNIKQFITEELGVEPIMINSALVSAQQRKRLYWTNINGVEQPEDKGILLKDILENGISYVEKSHCITASYNGAEIKNSLTKGQRTMVFEPITLKDKSQTICTQFHKANVKSLIKRKSSGLIVAEEVGAALRTRADENGKFKRLEVRHDGKFNSLTTVQTDSVVCLPVQQTDKPIRLGHFGKGGQGDRIYSVSGKTVCISANGGGRGAVSGLYKIDLPDGDYTIRKLSPIEVERAQTLPNNYTALGIDDKENVVKISNTQRYRGCGNGWTISVITHILSYMNL